MSRFSLAEAKGLGWTVTHADVSGEGSGERYSAEKTFDGALCREYGPTMGLLLERVFAYEAHRAARGYVNPDVAVPDAEPAPEDAAEEVTPKRRRRNRHGSSSAPAPTA